jgi:hypothetical protein
VQLASQQFDNDLLALAQETRRVARSIDDLAIAARLFEVADQVLQLAYLGDRSNKAELTNALACLDLNRSRCPTP